MPNKHFISLADARKMIRHFREKKEHILNAHFKKAGSLPVCETFDRAAFDRVLAKPGCAGIRIYFALDEQLQIRVVIVGVNENNEDMITSTATMSTINAGMTGLTLEGTTNPETDTSDGDIIEQGTRCPDVCPPDSLLTIP